MVSEGSKLGPCMLVEMGSVFLILATILSWACLILFLVSSSAEIILSISCWALITWTSESPAIST